MRKNIIAAMLLTGMVVAPAMASAQSAVEGRVDRLEHEMRAVQRKVFPNGSGQQVFEPQITSPETSAGPGPGVPATSPVADLSARVSALESQLSQMTGQIETTQHRVQLLEDGFAAYKRATDARLRALESAGAPEAAPGESAALESPRSGPAVPPVRPTVKPVPGVGDKDAGRAQRVAAIEHPATGDEVEDAYLYGYRLWQAKLYPEAEAALKGVVTKYPKARRASYAQNLLGRSYLDDGKPSLASMAFYDNYKKMPDGERAPDSLFYLAQALVKLNKPADACKVYGELGDVYGAKISAGMKSDIAQGRSAAKCQ